MGHPSKYCKAGDFVIFLNLVFLLIWRIMVIQMNLMIMVNMAKLMIWMILVNMVILIMVNFVIWLRDSHEHGDSDLGEFGDLAACGDSHE